MMDQELLHDLTESYLKPVISEEADSLSADFDSFAAFGELGINSFQVLKILKVLERDFGRLPKSLLFESFNVHDLARYFAKHHEVRLRALFADEARVLRPTPAVLREEREHGGADSPVRACGGLESPPPHSTQPAAAA